MSYYYGSPPPPPMASAGYYQQSLYGAAPPPMMPPPQPQQQQQPYPRAHTHYGYGPMSGGMPPSSSGTGYYGQPVAMPQAPPPRMPSAPPQQPTPQSSNMNDPNIFRNYFRSGLQALTYNSRQIIQDLTLLANDFALRMSSIVGEEIDGHIRTVSPDSLTPSTFFLLMRSCDCAGTADNEASSAVPHGLHSQECRTSLHHDLLSLHGKTFSSGLSRC